MAAAPHLWQRARRWWNLRLMQTRADQLALLIAEIEACIERDRAELAALRPERVRLTMRLQAAGRCIAPNALRTEAQS